MNAGGDASDLLPAARPRGPALLLALLALSFVAALAIIGLSAALRSAPAWAARLGGSVTVAAAGGGLESSDAAAARAAEILTKTPGVSRARVLDPAPTDAMISGLVAGADLPGEMGPPRLVAATMAAARPSGADIAALLTRQGLKVAVDDHRTWTGPLERIAMVGAGGAALLVLCLLGAVCGLTGVAASAAVNRSATRLRLLIHLGATDASLLRPFRNAFAIAALWGALLGAFAAAALTGTLVWSPEAAIWLAAHGVEAPAMLTPDGLDVAAALLWPPAATLAGLWAATAAVRGRLRALS